MKRLLTSLLIIGSLSLAACGNQSSIEKVEIQEMLDFEEAKPETQQVITDAQDVKVIEKVFNKARELGDFEDNKIPPQYTVKLGENEYYLWIDTTETATIADVENKSLFYNIIANEEFKEIINFQGQK